ncbi:conserved hypothetical protein [Perkinsus marinus ATCC 50983]|uniref:Alpha/beta hydrolase fold-3 domain-containing protein n=1 Tax=Perkinsus marinus (strain ATCC 50983 / TXsc) TaxID=423536 RepID=C5L0D2_PERM5|nr:conserved hypothetical protein [Perkinsus marinus ATCC 50983]EER09990.1 conserved hypothetical protein [Perkinsus marinus ATCC 50983]|eukprot:XP_002778195.1 conserved hypothetical protein [Perkinsus marinus ATCC 50983]
MHGGFLCFYDGVSTHRLFVARMVDVLQKRLREDGMDGVKVVALIVNYTLAPKAVLPTQLQEVVQGYKYILTQDRYPVEASHVVVSGDSSGGTLSLSLLKCLVCNYFAVDLPRPGCCVAMSPVVDMRGRLGRRSLDVIPLGQIAINRWADFVSKAIEGEKMPVGQAFAIFEDSVEPLHKQDVHQETAAMAQAA